MISQRDSKTDQMETYLKKFKLNADYSTRKKKRNDLRKIYLNSYFNFKKVKKGIFHCSCNFLLIN